MSRGMQVLGIIILSILAIGAINLIKDTTEASMLESVDLDFYAQSNGQIRMDKEKFAESFIRRFAENVANDRNYRIQFLDISETPPKVSVRVGSYTTATFSGEGFNIENKVDAILETKYAESRTLGDVLVENDITTYEYDPQEFVEK